VNGNGIPELSVIITMFNAAGTIERCLQSLRAQRTSRRYEVVVVDSGRDETARQARHDWRRFVRHQFSHGQWVGKVRSQARRFSPWRRAAHAATS
jgi:glycosyltransferase involved in cell wall biosynthesis